MIESVSPARVSVGYRVTAVPFEKLPGISRLFLDYVRAFPRVAPLYGTEEWSLEAVAARAAACSNGTVSRARLIEVLADQNDAFQAGERTAEQLQRLTAPRTVAVVTGQQPGLFSGPLFTLYKALTAVKLADALCARGVRAVPVFWIAGDDHDLAEINHCHVVSTRGELVSVAYAAPGPDRQPVGSIRLTPSIDEQVRTLFSALPPTAAAAALQQQIRRAYDSDTTLGTAFARLLASVLAPYGLIWLDATDPRLKALAAPVFEEAVARAADIARALVERSAALKDAGYHAQLHVERDGVPLFVIRDGRRVALRAADGRIGTKDGGYSWTAAEARTIARDRPALFSPNAALRPIVQDTLLPTAAYVGGPAEVAYFAQLEPLYRLFGRPPTPVVPRASFTIVEHHDEKTLTKFGLDFVDLIAGVDTVWSSVMGNGGGGELARALDEADGTLRRAMDALLDAVRASEPSLDRAASRCRDEMLHQLGALRARYAAALRAKQTGAVARLSRTLNALLPGGQLQERQLTMAHFVARFGGSFLDEVYQAMEIDRADHRLLFPGPVSYSASAPFGGDDDARR
jgi:bacillithiol biosynthesis cysteine-adding enzyme BshC